ncbi:hypothetical protein T459_14909 [Capsicum annuum]|uniref:Uncharacterized protein n=1 Tax=Capsicum annuum TaxID=4072 RepID=A0A2G2ZIZ2_CAPAN|nr:hypothetical protein T459_14909 [Capsicum annuum]
MKSDQGCARVPHTLATDAQRGFGSAPYVQYLELAPRAASIIHKEEVKINNNSGLNESSNYNEYNLNTLTRIHWKASPVPCFHGAWCHGAMFPWCTVPWIFITAQFGIITWLPVHPALPVLLAQNVLLRVLDSVVRLNEVTASRLTKSVGKEVPVELDSSPTL